MKEYRNSWIFAPNIWEVLIQKYFPEYKNKRISLCNSILNSLNEKLMKSGEINDRIVWELSMNQLFNVHDRFIISKALKIFADTYYTGEDKKNIYERLCEIAHNIKNLDAGYKYFILDVNNVGDGPATWFYKMDEKTFEMVPNSIYEWPPEVTELVCIENGEIVEFIDICTL